MVGRIGLQTLPIRCTFSKRPPAGRTAPGKVHNERPTLTELRTALEAPGRRAVVSVGRMCYFVNVAARRRRLRQATRLEQSAAKLFEKPAGRGLQALPVRGTFNGRPPKGRTARLLDNSKRA